MKKAVTLFALLMAATITMKNAWSQDDSSQQATNSPVQRALKKLGMNKVEVKASPTPGLKMVFSENGILFITDDGKYILQGPMYDISNGTPLNVTSPLLAERIKQLEPEMIVYSAPKEQFTVTVFTDVTCGYCRKLHQQIKEYNDLGITIRYLAFPRQGLASDSEKTMRAIWCSADRKKIFDAAIRGDNVVPVTCPVNIARHYQTGAQFGIQGTPAIVLSDGTLLPGYEEPQALLTLLQQHKKITQKQLDSGNAEKNSEPKK